MRRKILGLAALLAFMSGPAAAQQTVEGIQPFVVNTLFIVFCAVLVMWMSAGFTMLEAGFVRSKNVVNQCAKNIGLFAIASTAFMMVGYGIMLPGGNWHIPGVFGSAGLVNITPVVDGSDAFTGRGHSAGSDVFFQSMFCVAVASIISGTIAERVKISSFFVFTVFMTALIYPMQASWTWGGGFLTTEFGFKDLAGSTVVHVVGGVAALTGALIIGPRTGRFVDGKVVALGNHSLPLATLGMFILWMGWFGFNAGSYLSFSSDGDAANVSRIFMNTNIAASGGVIAAAFISYLRENRFDLSFMMNGALGGLVAITAEPLFPNPVEAFSIGMCGGIILFWSTQLMNYLKVDDVVGAIPVHLFCGVWGTLAVVISNPDATLLGQFVSVLIVIAFVGVSTAMVWFLLKETIGVRVSADSERVGVDESELVLEN